MSIGLFKQSEDLDTPAGTFNTEPGLNTQNDNIVWIDYYAAISMHRVRALKGARQMQRLANATPKDNRISYGCINVPAGFFKKQIQLEKEILAIGVHSLHQFRTGNIKTYLVRTRPFLHCWNWQSNARN